MHPSVLLALVGLVYLLGFGALSYFRQQGLPIRFAVEGLLMTALGVGLSLVPVPVHPLLLLVLLYLVTMRVRLLVDLGNWFTMRGQYKQAFGVYRFALRLGPDPVSKQLVQINWGVAHLRMNDPEAAYLMLEEALAGEQVRVGAKYMAAGYYNLGLACRRTGREAEAIRRLNEAITALPGCIYAQAARRALQERSPD